MVNLVAQAGIEKGMLSVLAFKQSLASGVLDGGASEALLQGTRLSRFMETVEEVAGAMGEVPIDGETDSGQAGEAASPRHAAGSAAPNPADEWAPPKMAPADAVPERTEPAAPLAGLIEAAAQLLRHWATPAAGATGSAAPRIERDPVTGQASVRLPLTEPAVLHSLAKALKPWLKQPSGGSEGA